MRKILLPMLILAAMSSCSKENTGTPDAGGLKEVRLGSGIKSQTKAAYNGDVAVGGLQFLRKDAAAAPTDFSGCTALSGERAQGGAITFDEAQYYAASGNTYFASYFPAGSAGNDAVTWTVDGRTDIMTADAVNAGSNAAPDASASLSYRHELAQIEVVCKAAIDGGSVQARWGEITGIKLLDTPTAMSYAYDGLAVTPGAEKGGIGLVNPNYTEDFAPLAVPASTNTAPNAAGMFVPSASQRFQLEISTTIGGVKVITIDLGAGESLKRSEKHIVTLTFQATQEQIGVSSSIETWTEGAAGSGSLD